MCPKKVRVILQEVALDHKEDLSLLQKLNSYYWDRIREILGSTEYSAVRVLNLGDFERKEWAIDGYIEKISNFKSKTREGSMANTKHKEVLVQLSKMKEFIEEEKNRGQQVKSKRDEYTKNLEEQKSHNGGNQELHI